MRWSKPSPYYAISDCGGYTVSQANMAGGPMYTAWSGKVPLLYTTDPKAAAKACADHKCTDRSSGS